ncbi:hypothetical protein ZIOFF_013492 [Zingiber officinale]|uniref:Uncharacterized protein n=1 Tax=Zingiber officinale TaxID=94328 RepID=A0A8J5HZM0_ZINOF|nr:hypothetical protein ZIOFF_013492 [Zingiber officinale]
MEEKYLDLVLVPLGLLLQASFHTCLFITVENDPDRTVIASTRRSGNTGRAAVRSVQKLRVSCSSASTLYDALRHGSPLPWPFLLGSVQKPFAHKEQEGYILEKQSRFIPVKAYDDGACRLRTRPMMTPCISDIIMSNNDAEAKVIGAIEPVGAQDPDLKVHGAATAVAVEGVVGGAIPPLEVVEDCTLLVLDDLEVLGVGPIILKVDEGEGAAVVPVEKGVELQWPRHRIGI